MSHKDISVIIPTYNRDIQVVQRTIDSILQLQEVKNEQLSLEIFIVDQNFPKLDLKSQYSNSEFSFYEIYAEDIRDQNSIERSKNCLMHLFGLNPSVTKAKNFVLSYCCGKYIVFFDDDVEVHQNCLKNYVDLLEKNPHIGFLGGREVIADKTGKRPYWKSLLLNFAFKLSIQKDHEYMVNGKYIGRIKPNSLMYWNFDEECRELVKIDSARGCNWATTNKILKTNNLEFDSFFDGCALREESDLYLRINVLGYQGFYTANSVVTHYRQTGGCDNLLFDTQVFLSKLKNEQYFQKKHFANVSRIFFFLRMFPLSLEYLKSSFGCSLLLLIKATFEL